MIELNLSEVKIFDDNLSELEILRKLIDVKNGEEPIHMLNIGEIIKKHYLWIEKMPRVVPYYAVKCNPNTTIIKVIAALGGRFDCASKQEIIQVMSHGVSGDRIIYANPIKFPSHIKYARKVGISMMTVDSEDELKKIKEIYPDAKIIIRIRCDATVTSVRLGEKFGCDPTNDAVLLIKATLDLGLILYGFSFHVGSPCGEPMAFCRGIHWCKDLIDTAKAMGCRDVQLIDIGGGIPGERDFIIDEFSDLINNALKEIDSSIKIISEPGRYYVTSASASAAYVFGKKTLIQEKQKTFMYYVSDGVFGSFLEELLNINTRHPVSLNSSTSINNEKYLSTVFGPTCASHDAILKNHMLPEYKVGDWLVWLDVGSYARCFSTKFNGFQPPKVYPIIRRKDWNDLWTKIKNRQQMNKTSIMIELDEKSANGKFCTGLEERF